MLYYNIYITSFVSILLTQTFRCASKDAPTQIYHLRLTAYMMTFIPGLEKALGSNGVFCHINKKEALLQNKKALFYLK